MGKIAKTALVLEDQPLIALDIEDVLEKIGFQTISVITSCADAETWLQTNTPDLAVIDVHLRDGVCVNVAQTLADNAIPFIVHSALDTHNSHDGSIFSRGTWVSKPSLPDKLASIVRQTLESA